MKVFVAEDSAAFRELLIGRLSKIQGIDLVGHAPSAAEAIESIQKLKPDVVILDLLLGKDNGVDVLQTLKKESPSTIVIVLTNYAGTATRKTCMELGAHCVMDKSWGVDETLGIVQELIPRFKQPAKS